MEAYYQGVGNGHPCASGIALHVVLAATDIDLYLLCLGRRDTEIGTALTIYLRELIAGNSGLGHYSIGRHLNLLVGLVAQQVEHLLAIASAQLAIACSIEMQIVWCIGASCR